MLGAEKPSLGSFGRTHVQRISAIPGAAFISSQTSFYCKGNLMIVAVSAASGVNIYHAFAILSLYKYSFPDAQNWRIAYGDHF